MVIDDDADLTEIPDCVAKYKAIVKRARKTQEKYNDAQFPSNDESLGEKITGQGIELEWERLGEHQDGKHVIFKDGVESTDIA